MNRKSNAFFLLLALCAAIIVAAVLWLARGSNSSQPAAPAVQSVPTLSPNANTDDFLQELQKTQDDGGASDFDQLQTESLEL